MVVATILKNDVTVEEREFFNRVNPNHAVTNDSIHLKFTNYCYGYDYEETLPIFKMREGVHGYTPYGMARCTGKHIVVARYSRYYKFDLNGNIVSLDAEDDDTNR